jgi:hypothetical protein
MKIHRLMDYFLKIAKAFLRKAGYTILRGDIRKNVKENSG